MDLLFITFKVDPKYFARWRLHTTGALLQRKYFSFCIISNEEDAAHYYYFD